MITFGLGSAVFFADTAASSGFDAGTMLLGAAGGVPNNRVPPITEDRAAGNEIFDDGAADEKYDGRSRDAAASIAPPAPPRNANGMLNELLSLTRRMNEERDRIPGQQPEPAVDKEFIEQFLRETGNSTEQSNTDLSPKEAPQMGDMGTQYEFVTLPNGTKIRRTVKPKTAGQIVRDRIFEHQQQRLDAVADENTRREQEALREAARRDADNIIKAESHRLAKTVGLGFIASTAGAAAVGGAVYGGMYGASLAAAAWEENRGIDEPNFFLENTEFHMISIYAAAVLFVIILCSIYIHFARKARGYRNVEIGMASFAMVFATAAGSFGVWDTLENSAGDLPEYMMIGATFLTFMCLMTMLMQGTGCNGNNVAVGIGMTAGILGTAVATLSLAVPEGFGAIAGPDYPEIMMYAGIVLGGIAALSIITSLLVHICAKPKALVDEIAPNRV